MRTVVVIPARFASTRLPGKPLLKATGKYLVQHAYEQAKRASAPTAVVVATDDDRIRAAVESFGGTAVMTRPDHPSGTDRVAEVAAGLDADAVINLQGDEPLFDPAAIDLLAELVADPAADVATLAVPIRDRPAYLSPHVVKVVCDDRGRALYFSRCPIPHYRDGEPDFAAEPVVRSLRDRTPESGHGVTGPQYFALQHLGVYAYRRDVLLRLAAAPPHALEHAEKLEQLRVLGLGGTIRVGVVAHAHRGIDTPEDYTAFVEHCRAVESRRAA